MNRQRHLIQRDQTSKITELERRDRIDDTIAKQMLGSSFHSIYTYDDLRTKSCNAAGLTGFTGKPPDYKAEHSEFVGDENFLLPFGVPSNFAGQPVALLLVESDAPKLVEMAAVRNRSESHARGSRRTHLAKA